MSSIIFDIMNLLDSEELCSSADEIRNITNQGLSNFRYGHAGGGSGGAYRTTPIGKSWTHGGSLYGGGSDAGGIAQSLKGGVGQRGAAGIAKLMSLGWSHEAAAAAMGNAQQESSIRSDGPLGDTARFGTGDDAAHGVFQWRGQRFRNLKAFAASKGKSWQDWNTQVEFFDHEATGSYGAGNWKTSKDIALTNRGMKHFEGYGDNSLGTRLANAKQLYGMPLGTAANPVVVKPDPKTIAKSTPSDIAGKVIERMQPPTRSDEDSDFKRAGGQSADANAGGGHTFNMTFHHQVSDPHQLAGLVGKELENTLSSRSHDLDHYVG